jgi:nitrate reductase gamma subunit
MTRRIGALFGMMLVVGLALLLLWRVELHATTTNADDLTTVSSGIG